MKPRGLIDLLFSIGNLVIEILFPKTIYTSRIMNSILSSLFNYTLIHHIFASLHGLSNVLSSKDNGKYPNNDGMQIITPSERRRTCFHLCSFLLAKIYNFGKYVRLSVCYLPKFTFWQVCSFVGLLLAKIYILASMFVCRFVCLSVCLSVSLSVLSSITHERFDISSPNLVHIWNGWAVPVCDIDK